MRSKRNSALERTNFICDEAAHNLHPQPLLLPRTNHRRRRRGAFRDNTLISGTFAIQSWNTWVLGLVSTNRGGTKRYFHFDGLGSTVALTDTIGNVQDTYTTSAFGVLESSTGASVNASVPWKAHAAVRMPILAKE